MTPGPEQDLSELFTRTRPRLQRMVAKLRIPPAEGEDLVQEAWLTLVRNRERIEKPEAWLVRTLFLMCCIYFRKRRRLSWLQSVDGHLLEDLAPPQSPGQERVELMRDLIALAAVLSQRERHLLHLRFALGLTAAEAAVRLGCRSTSIGKLTARALARARRAAGCRRGLPQAGFADVRIRARD